MKITYDKQADAINVILRSGKVAKTLEVAPEMYIDVDKSGKTLSLEIIGASEKIGKKNFSTVTVGTRSLPLPVFA